MLAGAVARSGRGRPSRAAFTVSGCSALVSTTQPAGVRNVNAPEGDVCWVSRSGRLGGAWRADDGTAAPAAANAASTAGSAMRRTATTGSIIPRTRRIADSARKGNGFRPGELEAVSEGRAGA